MIDEKLLILLGLGFAGAMATAVAYQDAEEEEYDAGLNENYYNTGISNDTIINYDIPKTKQHDVSPLEFGSMVGKQPIKEQYVPSDYVHLDDITKNPNKIQVYNASNDTIGLPIGDMTDVGAAESNKYIYDRTIGTIGFTSTKIGARQRDGADKIRGDLPIIPNKTGWFQTAADPSTALLLGAMNVNNGIADVGKPTTISVLPVTGKSGAAHAVKKGGDYSNLDDLREKAEGRGGSAVAHAMQPGGAAHMMQQQAPKEPLTVQALINASINQKISDNRELGEGTLYVNQ